jgi:oxaloacetate decarboxylase beta subunit
MTDFPPLRGSKPAREPSVKFREERQTWSMLNNFYQVIIGSTIGPLLIFMGVGAMTDFGRLLANPKTMLLGAAAQFGIFVTVIGAALLDWLGVLEFTILEAAAIGIIGGVDGPTSTYVSSVLAPHLIGAVSGLFYGC